MRRLLFEIALVMAALHPLWSDTLSVLPETREVVVETVFVERSEPCAYDKDQILPFADELFDLGDYDRAAVEYLRFAFLYPDDSCAAHALFKSALCKEKIGDYTAARKLYQMLSENYGKRAKRFANYRIPLTYFLEGKLDSAADAMDTTDATLLGAFEYLRGWIRLRACDYAAAETSFRRLADASDSSEITGSIRYLLHRCAEAKRMGRRSPFLAAMLSAAAPGLGRGYCGRWGDALFSALAVGVPTALSATTWEKDRTFAIFMGALGAFFYVGNIYGSAKGAAVYNEEKAEAFWQRTWSEVIHPPTMLFSELRCEGGE